MPETGLLSRGESPRDPASCEHHLRVKHAVLVGPLRPSAGHITQFADWVSPCEFKLHVPERLSDCQALVEQMRQEELERRQMEAAGVVHGWAGWLGPWAWLAGWFGHAGLGGAFGSQGSHFQVF